MCASSRGSASCRVWSGSRRDGRAIPVGTEPDVADTATRTHRDRRLSVRAAAFRIRSRTNGWWGVGLVSPPQRLLVEPPGIAAAPQPTDARGRGPPVRPAQRPQRAPWLPDVPLRSPAPGVRALPVHEPAAPLLLRSRVATRGPPAAL